ALRVGAVATVEAGAARDVMVDDDAVALTKARDAGGARGNGAGNLVAEDPRPVEQALLDLLDVGDADAAHLDANEDLAGIERRHRDVLDGEGSLLAIDGGAHGWRSYQKPGGDP